MSGFFSSSETGMMSLNKYRLRHLVQQKHKVAIRVYELLKRPERLIGVILIGNNLVNNLAVSITTVIAIRMWPENPDQAIYVGTIALTFIVLIFAEVTPKTIAALHPESIAFPASFILTPLLKVLSPAVWLVNSLANIVLRLTRMRLGESGGAEQLSTEELRTVVNEAGARLPVKRKTMLLSVLDLEKMTVNDIMVPRHEVVGIDINADIETIISQLKDSEYTRLPVFKDNINNVVGILHMRKAARFLKKNTLTRADLLQQTNAPYFIPENTPLHTQLVNFQKEKHRIGLVVDEYGDIQGVATLEDLLEEIVGEFTTDISTDNEEITRQNDGSFFIKGTASIRDINRRLKWTLPTEGPKTLNGLILEVLESIPEAVVCLQISGYNIEILQINDNMISLARIQPI